MAFKAVNNFGMDKELADKMNAKYDHALEKDMVAWIEATLGMTFTEDFATSMKSGVVLCDLVNKLLPGKIKKINRTGGLFKLQENITGFLRVCREVGVIEASLFPTESLAQTKDMNQVLMCINAFKTQVEAGNTGSGNGGNGNIAKKKSKWVVKPGGGGGMSLLNAGSSKVMQPTKYTDARENIKRGKTENKGAASSWNEGASKMERLQYTDAREQIKRNQLDGKGSSNDVSALNAGSKMERQKYTDAREQIKRGEL